MQRLHQAIIDDPDDVAARRVYADALLAEGNPRGELINVQCALEDAPLGERVPLLKRESELLKIHARVWLAPYNGAIFKPEFRRGFVETALANTKKFIPVARALLDAEPITELHLRELTVANAATLGAVPGLGRLRTLRAVESKLATKGAAALFANPLPKLRNLNLYQAGIDDGGLEHVSRVFGQLERLNLAGTRVTRNGLARLLADPRLANLRYLHLNWLLTGGEGASFLGEHLALPNLTHLDLSSSQLRAEHVKALQRNAVVRRLRGLRLAYNDLAGAEVIDAIAPMEHLEVLDLNTTKPGVAGLAALAQLALPLRFLKLYQCEVDDDQLRALAKAPFPLRRLDLAYGSFTAAGIEAIGNAGWPLETLELWACKIGDAGLAALANADFTATLRKASLGYTGIGDDGLIALAKAPWPRLEHLVFRGDAFSKVGMAALATLPALRTVRFDLESPSKATLKPLVDRGVRID